MPGVSNAADASASVASRRRTYVVRPTLLALDSRVRNASAILRPSDRSESNST
jgi:hypothetical protein